MNQSVHQLIQVILQGIAWLLHTIEMLWVWSWSQISTVFSTPWDNLPGWKIAQALMP